MLYIKQLAQYLALNSNAKKDRGRTIFSLFLQLFHLTQMTQQFLSLSLALLSFNPDSHAFSTFSSSILKT